MGLARVIGACRLKKGRERGKRPGDGPGAASMRVPAWAVRVVLTLTRLMEKRGQRSGYGLVVAWSALLGGWAI